MKITVIGGAPGDLARRISKRLGARYVGSDLRVFADGEGKITLRGSPKGGTAVIVQSAFPPVDSNLIRAISLIAKAKKHCTSVVAVIPYMGYARQDKEFLSGEIITMDVIARMFRAAGAKKIIMVDIHSKAGLEKFGRAGKNVSAAPELAKYFKKMRLKEPLVVSPDLGGTARAKEFAILLKSDCISLSKRRNRKTGRISITNSGVDGMTGRDLILVDDMISTGGSIIKATEFLKKQGCARVFVACTHALLIGDAAARIKKAGVSRIISTNTIPGATGVVDVSGVIADAI